MLVRQEAIASQTSFTSEFELRAVVTGLSVCLGIAIFAFSFANAFNTNMDDIWVMYPPDRFDWLRTHVANLRFVVVGLGHMLLKLDVTYFQLIGLWSTLLVGSFWALAYQLARYLGFGLLATVWIFAAASTHGFMAEIYSFTMGYANYVGGMMGAALLLAASRHAHQLWAFPVGAVGAFITLGSYQPFILVPAFAYCLRLWRDNIDKAQASVHVRELILLGSAVLAGTLAILACKQLFAPELVMGRGLSARNIPINAVPYLATIADIHFTFTRPYDLIYPWHERYFFLVATLAFILLAIVRFAQAPRSPSAALALGASLLTLLLIPGPFNLLGLPYWPTPKSMASVAFFQAALVPCLVTFLPTSIQASRRWFLGAGLAFLALSTSSQASRYFERHLQARTDIQLATAIIADLRNRTEIGPTTKIAIKSSWRNMAQRPTAFLDYGLSAFSASWSSPAILRMASGVSFRDGQIPEQGCDGHRGTYELREINGSWLVCMK